MTKVLEPGTVMETQKSYEEHSFSTDLQVVGIAYNHDRVWFCINGLSVMRAKIHEGRLVIEYIVPDSIEEDER